MGQKDQKQKIYFDNAERFADVVNGVFFGGKQVIDASDLSECDSVITTEGNGYIIERICDKQKKHSIAIWILENQENINYAMPVRVMLREAMEYDKQCKEQAQLNEAMWKKEGYPQNKGEFLQRFCKEDKLLPVVTLVIYWGDEPWDGAKSMHEMLEFRGEDPISELVSDYKIHVYDLNDSHDYNVFKTDLRIVFELYQRRKDKDAFRQYYEENALEHVSIGTAKFIGEITNTKRIIEMIENEKKEVEIEKEEDKVMCQAMDEIFYVYDHADELIEQARKEARETVEIAQQEVAKAKEAAKEAAEKATKEATEKSRIDTLYLNLKNIIEELNSSIERAMDILKVSDADRAILMERF